MKIIQLLTHYQHAEGLSPNFLPHITDFLTVKTHILTWPSTNSSPFPPSVTTSYKHDRHALPDPFTVYSIFQEAQPILKASFKSDHFQDGKVCSYLSPWHKEECLPGQGCLANMYKIARDSPKPLIRDKLISCILLQGHFFNCMLEGDLASKLLISCQNYSSMFSIAVSPSLTALSEITFFCVVVSLRGCHAQLSQVQVNQVYGAWVDPLWNQEGNMQMQELPCVQHSSGSAVPPLPWSDGWNQDHLWAWCYNSAMRGRSELLSCLG